MNVGRAGDPPRRHDSLPLPSPTNPSDIVGWAFEVFLVLPFAQYPTHQVVLALRTPPARLAALRPWHPKDPSGVNQLLCQPYVVRRRRAL